jgi:dolichyl-phosphooligosaccharide-protein glycotransferase
MKKYIIFIICLSVLGINIYFRASPIYFPHLKGQAKKTAEQKIAQQAIEEIDDKFPEFDALAKKRLVNAWIANYKKQNSHEIKDQIRQEYLKSKGRLQDDTGSTYLLELDPWNWARYTENVLQSGHPADVVINGRQIDSLMNAPYGKELPWNHFLYYLSAFLYKLFSFFKPVPLHTFLFYIPLFFTAIFLAVLFLFCYLHWGAIAAVTACLFVGLTPILVFRSYAGWFDTDILNLLFPLLAVWAYIKAYAKQPLKWRLFWVNLAAFCIGIFSFTWVAWWFILTVIIIYEVYILLNLLCAKLQYKQDNTDLVKAHLVLTSILLFLSLLWVIAFSGIMPLKDLFQTKTLNYLVLNKALTYSIWPNVFPTVGELGKLDLPFMVDSLGGPLFFVFSIAAMVILFLRNSRERNYGSFNLMLISIMTIWFVAMLFASIMGRRFVMFLTIPLGISLGWIVTDAYQFIRKFKRKWFNGLFIACITVIFSNLIMNSFSLINRVSPLMIDDTLYGALVKIRKATPEDSVINSWWDFGDWFKAIARRRVIFDGQSQNTPQAYWMAHVFMTDNEREAVRILQMLNNGGNRVFEIINERLKDPFRSVTLLEKIILLEPKDAKEKLSGLLPASSVDEAMKLIFSKPAKAYFIVDSSMTVKIPILSYLGNWDFLKVYMLKNPNKNTNQLIDYFMNSGIDSRQIEMAKRYAKEVALIGASDREGWVSHRLNIYGRPMISGFQKGENVFFDNGMVYDIKNRAVHLYASGDAKFKLPRSLFIFENGKLEEVVFADKKIDFSVLLIKSAQDYKAVLLDRELASSLFVRLYFLGGEGLKHFKPFLEEKTESGYIRVFEIIWE